MIQDRIINCQKEVYMNRIGILETIDKNTIKLIGYGV